MKTNAYDHSIRFLSKVHKNYTTIILGAKATYLRLLISELREMGALSDRALSKANRSIQDRLKQDQA